MQSQIKLKLIDPVHVPENKMMWKVGRMIEPTYEGRSQITWTFWIRKIFNESMSYTPYIAAMKDFFKIVDYFGLV